MIWQSNFDFVCVYGYMCVWGRDLYQQLYMLLFFLSIQRLAKSAPISFLWIPFQYLLRCINFSRAIIIYIYLFNWMYTVLSLNENKLWKTQFRMNGKFELQDIYGTCFRGIESRLLSDGPQRFCFTEQPRWLFIINFSRVC